MYTLTTESKDQVELTIALNRKASAVDFIYLFSDTSKDSLVNGTLLKNIIKAGEVFVGFWLLLLQMCILSRHSLTQPAVPL